MLTGVAQGGAASTERTARTYDPPESPSDDHWFWLGLKVAVAMFIANWIAMRAGFASPTWSVLAAAFLATNPPLRSGKAALRKLIATAVGVAVGVAGVYAGEALAQMRSLHFALVGAVTGLLGSRSPDYLYAAVVGTVITFTAANGNDPTVEVVTRTVCMILIGCAVGPAVVYGVERLRAALAGKRWA